MLICPECGAPMSTFSRVCQKCGHGRIQNEPPEIDPVKDATQRLESALSNLKDAQRRQAIAVAEMQSALAYLKEVTK